MKKLFLLFFLIITTNSWAICTQTQFNPWTNKFDYCESGGSGSGTGTVNSGIAGRFAVYTTTGTAVDDTTTFRYSGNNVIATGDLTVSGDDLFMGTNTSGFILVADGTNYNPVAMSNDVAIASNGATTIQANAVGLGTDTTGDFVGTITAGTNISTTGAATGEGIAHAISLNLTNHSQMLYVGKWGNDSNDGLTPNDAKLTIAAANTAASSGDTILVYPGTYSETEIELKAGVNLIGQDRASTIVTGSPTEGTSISDTHGVIEPNGSTYIADISIIDTSSPNTKQFTNAITLEAADSAVTLENVYTDGGYDSILTTSGVNNIDLVVKNSRIQSDFDPFGLWSDNGSSVEIFNTHMISNVARTSETEFERCLAVGTNPAGEGTNTTVNVYGGSCNVNGGSGDTKNAGFWVGNSSTCASEAFINLYGVQIVVVGQSGDAAYGLFTQTGCPAGTINMYGGSMNISGGSTNNMANGASGAITVRGAATNTITTAGTVSYYNYVGIDGLDALTDIDQGIKTAANDTSKLVVGTAGSTDEIAKWDSSGNLVDTNVIFGTMTDGKWCSYASSGTLLSCTQDTPAGSGDITDVFDCASGNCQQITMTAGDILDTTNGTLELPQQTDCSGEITEGRTCWDTDNDHLYVGNGATATQIDGAGGSGDITSVGDVTSGAAFDGTQGTTLTFNDADGDKTILFNTTTNGFEANAKTTITGTLLLDGAEATAVSIHLCADECDDVADQWLIDSQTDNDLDFINGVTSKMKIEQDGSLVVTGDGSQSTITEGLVVNNGQQSDEDDDFTVMCGATACLTVDAGDNTTTTTNQSVSGTMLFTTTGEIGFRFINGTDNTACNTQCTRGCFIGILNATGTAVTGFVNCSDATADECICGGGS